MASNILPDATAWIDYFNDVKSSLTATLDAHLVERRADVGDLILFEVMRGIRQDPRYLRILGRLMTLPFFTISNPAIALAAANNYRFLRAPGITIRSSIDCLIATYCIETGTALLHNDRDFDPFEEHLGLEVVR